MKEGKQKINIHDEKYKLTSSMNRKWTKLSNELNKLEKKEKKKKKLPLYRNVLESNFACSHWQHYCENEQS